MFSTLVTSMVWESVFCVATSEKSIKWTHQHSEQVAYKFSQVAIGSDWTLEIVQQACHDVGEFDDHTRSFNTPKKKKSPEELKANRELSVRKFRENALAKREEKEGREQVLAMAQKFSPQGKGLKRRSLQCTGQCSAPMQCAVFGKSALSDWKVGDMIYKLSLIHI